MRLPAEVHMKGYKEFSTLQGVVESCDGGCVWEKRTVQLLYDCEIHETGHNYLFDPTAL